MQIIHYLCIVSFLTMFISCNDGNDDSVTPSHNVTYLRFISPSGTNVLDSLDVIEEGLQMHKIDTDLIRINGYRTSDNQPLEISKYFYHVSENNGVEFSREETLIRLDWYDFNIWDVEKRAYQYKEMYEILLFGPRIFGDNDTHQLKWYVNVAGRVHDAYQCEVEGRMISLDDDLIYNQRTYDGRHAVAGIITFCCK